MQEKRLVVMVSGKGKKSILRLACTMTYSGERGIQNARQTLTQLVWDADVL